MKGKVVALYLGCCLLSAAACSDPLPRQLRTDRAPPTYVPPADRAAPWLTVDIDTDNAVRYRDKVVFDPAVDDPVVLVRALRALRDQAVESGRIRLRPAFEFDQPTSLDDPLPASLPNSADDLVPRVLAPIRVEAHRWSLWAATANLMQVASGPDIAFAAIQLALMDVPD